MTTTVLHSPSQYRPKRKGSLNLGGVSLKPGVNYLSDAQLKAIIAHPSYPRLKEWGCLQIKQSDSTPSSRGKKEVKPPDTLEAYDIKGGEGEVGAEDLVANTKDISLLKQWLEAETRVTLKRIITERIKDLRGTI